MTVIKAARIFDGRSDALLRNSSVVEANKIAGLGNSARVPTGSEVIDLGDVTRRRASLTRILTSVGMSPTIPSRS